MSYLMASVYINSAAMCDTTNGGVSACRGTLFVPHPRGNFKESDIDKIAILEYDSTNTCRPLFRPAGKKRGMFGGNFVYSSDSRFRELYGHNPVPIHDRFE